MIDLDEAERRAMLWIAPSGCAPVTRDTALNEEHLALDVVELASALRTTRSVIAARLHAIVGPMWSEAYCGEVAGKLLEVEP